MNYYIRVTDQFLCHLGRKLKEIRQAEERVVCMLENVNREAV